MGVISGVATAAVTTPLMTPTSVAVDQFGNLLIVETGAHRVRQVAADGRIRTIVAVSYTHLDVYKRQVPA